MKNIFLEFYTKHKVSIKYILDRIIIGIVLAIPIEIVIFAFTRKAAWIFFAGFLLGCANFAFYYTSTYIILFYGSNKPGIMQFMSFTIRYGVIGYFLYYMTRYYGFYSIYGAAAIVFMYFISSFYTLLRSAILKLIKYDTPEC